MLKTKLSRLVFVMATPCIVFILWRLGIVLVSSGILGALFVVGFVILFILGTFAFIQAMCMLVNWIEAGE